MGKLLRGIIWFCYGYCCFFRATAQEERLYAFTIESAITAQSTEVTTASKTGERIEEAPGIITIVTAEEIRAFGALSLYQILDRLTSTYMLSTPLHPNNVLSLRGDNSAHYTQKVLFLLNGRPIRESLVSGIMMAIINSLPVDQIERLEVIRGPGSVLYGTGAFHGVINIITKKEQKPQGYFTYGGYGRVQGGASAGKQWEAGSISGGINFFQEQGWDFTTTAQDAPQNAQGQVVRTPQNTQTIRMGLEGMGAQLNANYKNLSFNAYYGASAQDAMFFVGAWIPKQIIDGQDTTDTYIRFRSRSQWIFADLGYQAEINKTWTAETHLTYNRQDLLETDPPANDDRARSYSSDWLLETTHYINPHPKLNLTLGGLLNALSGNQILPQRQNTNSDLDYTDYDIYNLNLGRNPDPFLITPQYNDLYFSLYGQLNYRIQPELRLIIGGQYNKVPQLKGDFVPRIALIYNYNPVWGGKLLFGQAFRSAAASERLIDFFPIIKGTPDLLPEKVSTFEAQLFRTSLNRRLRTALTFFYARQRNLIAILPDDAYFLSGVYQNTGQRDMSGVEWELSWKPNDRWMTQLSATYQRNEQDFALPNNESVTVQNITGMPQAIAKSGIHYAPDPAISFGLFYSFFGGNAFAPVRYRDTNGEQQTLFARRAVNPDVTAVHWVSLQARYEIDAFGGKLALIFYGDNLLGQQVHVPEYTVQAVNSLPGRGGRMVYGTLRYQF